MLAPSTLDSIQSVPPMVSFFGGWEEYPGGANKPLDCIGEGSTTEYERNSI